MNLFIHEVLHSWCFICLCNIRKHFVLCLHTIKMGTQKVMLMYVYMPSEFWNAPTTSDLLGENRTNWPSIRISSRSYWQWILPQVPHNMSKCTNGTKYIPAYNYAKMEKIKFPYSPVKWTIPISSVQQWWFLSSILNHFLLVLNRGVSSSIKHLKCCSMPKCFKQRLWLFAM